MFVIDIRKGEYFEKWNGYQLGNLEECKFNFPDQFFEGFILSHVIEHIVDPTCLIENIVRTSKKGSLIYVEFPSPHTISIPKKETFGDLCVISNFYDDKTHLKIYSLDSIKNLFGEHGFYTISEGIIFNPFLEDLLLKEGEKLKDPEIYTYGIWLKIRFASYIILEKRKDFIK